MASPAGAKQSSVASEMKQSHKNSRLPRRYVTRNDLSYEIAVLSSQRRIAALPMVAVKDKVEKLWGNAK